MAVENPSYINELNQNWPDGLDPKSQGDDHLRNIKKAVKQTFPNITGPVTMTQAQLNQLGTPGVVNFPGMIVMWSGTVANIPAGWKLCNGTGTISTGAAIPNLTDRFIVGAGNLYGLGTTGGSVSHTHGVTVAGTALTIDQIPEHDHLVNGNYVQGLTGGGGQVNCVLIDAKRSGKTGGGQAHTHTATASSVSNLPPYYALFYIIKD